MNKFFNNLKRKFTAPKTRDMQKKIESMEDYLGIAEKEFKQMQKDAEFYKKAQEALSKARRALKSGGELFKDYNSPSIFLKEVTNYKCATLNNIPEFSQDVDALPTKVTTNLTDKCLAMYQTFCRTRKQKIKDIFEGKMKKFSKEKTKLAELSKLTKVFDQEKDSCTLITVWESVKAWYESIEPNLIDKDNNPVTQVYKKTLELARKKLPEAIQGHLTDLCNKICSELDKTSKYDISQTLTQLKMDFDGKVSTCKKICEDLEDKKTLSIINQKEVEVKNKMKEKIGYCI